MADCNANNKGGTGNLSAAFPDQNNPDGKSGLQINAVDNPAFNVNALLIAAQNYNAMNSVVNRMIGMDLRWFRSIPQQRSQDVIFQEYTLSNVEDTPICIKAVLPSGNFPESKYNYDMMGLEYEIPLEIHIDKLYWEEIAGGGTAPQKKDVVYFAVPNKLYEVVSSYLARGFMEQETTWKINLRKYQPEASRREGDVLKETISKYTVSQEEIFGEKKKSDIEKIVDKKQMSPLNSTEIDVYKILDPQLTIVNSDLEIYGMKVAESFYDLSSSKYFNAVKYKGKDIITQTTDRSITAWTMIDPGVVDELSVNNITQITGDVNSNYQISINSKHDRLQIGSYVEVYRPGALNFYAKIIDDAGSVPNSYKVWIDQPVIDHLNSIRFDWMGLSNYRLISQNPVSILDGINTTKDTGFKIDIFANQYVKIKYGQQEHIAVITDKLLNKKWYGIVVNIANTFNQYFVSIFKEHPTDSTSKLENIFYETLDLLPEETEVEFYTINKSPSLYTNLRLYATGIEEEKQINDLLRYFVKDGDQLIIGDNADIRMHAPYTGQQR